MVTVHAAANLALYPLTPGQPVSIGPCAAPSQPMSSRNRKWVQGVLGAKVKNLAKSLPAHTFHALCLASKGAAPLVLHPGRGTGPTTGPVQS